MAQKSHKGTSKRIDEDLHQLGSNIRARRKKLGITRKTLASRSQTSERYLAQLESGSGNPSVAVLTQIAEALDMSVHELIPDRHADPELRELMDQVKTLSPSRKKDFVRFANHWVNRKESPERKQRISLIGLRGAGKSTLAKIVSRKLDVPYIELTREIEKESGLAIQEIYSLYGDHGYRELESQCLNQILKSLDCFILAVAGGISTNPDTYETLLEHTHAVWLKADADDHMKRVLQQGDRRPLTGVTKAMEALEKILVSRQQQYSRAEITLNTSGKTVEECGDELASVVSRILTAETHS